MGNADYEVDQPFWTIARGVVTGIAPAQLVAFLLLCCVVKTLAIVTLRQCTLPSVLAISIGASFVLWPHIYTLLQNGSLLIVSDFFEKPVGKTVALFILIPILMNQLSLFLLLGVVPLWSLAKSTNRLSRWSGYVGTLLILPLAWFLDCFLQAPH